ncbi:PAAR domain-containing protein [Caballeronia novacaledonica]|jgi:uncharacterized Zn-binding protein involved in type VI secretion|uniref:PAAR repeat-containing protein n=1 Tax=Caballeronia novacaledonica TaxID=1544861 RepID=A0AA37IEM7_9BURK|nr:PAAR domain-containing protein [Caballeronia novacaledonica]GJH27829.1 hypothetical protein CBA19CS42_24955 [Caballeronia novacaledonica]
MTDRLAAKGDWTTTKGRILGGSSSWYAENGKTLARSYDLASCGTCKGGFPIYGTADTWLDEGKALVRHMDRILCPCGKNFVLASSESSFLFTTAAAVEDESPNVQSRLNITASETWDCPDEQIRAVDARSGQPIAGLAYYIEAESGMTFQGFTDSAGLCPRITSQAPEQLRVWFGDEAERKSGDTK